MRLTLLSLLVLLSCYGFSQTCTQRLKQAEDDYEAGKLLGIPGQLESCLKARDGFSKEEIVRARKLLTLVYIFTDQEARAETAMIELLKADAEHRLDPQVDPAELFFLYDQFRTKPIFRIGLKFGTNVTFPSVIEEYGTFNVNNHQNFYNGKTTSGATEYTVGDGDEAETYSAISGLSLGLYGELLFEKEVKSGLEVVFGPQFRISTYSVDSYVNQETVNTTIQNDQTYLRAPLAARYTLGAGDRDNKLLPYGFVGASFDYLITASSEGKLTGGRSYTLASDNLKNTSQVREFNYSVFGGIGVKIRNKTNFVTVEARYDKSLQNYVDGNNRYTNQEYVFDFAYVEPAIVLNLMSFSVGYTFSIYNPKKL
ncbi:MAG: outer membrane beta-barrel protein [Marinoscillum sp.]